MFLKRTWQLFFSRLSQIGIGWWIIFWLVVLIEALWLIKIRKSPKLRKNVYCSILAVYLLMIIIATVLSRDILGKNYWNKLISFDISTAWTGGPGVYGAVDTANELMLNVLMFVPFGFLIARIADGKKWAVFGGCLLITLSIEMLQLFLKRGFFELADILLNMSGAVVGYWLFRMTAKKKR